MEKYVSGEQHKEMVSTVPPKRNFGGPLVVAVAVIVLLAVGFAAGVGYQKGHQSPASNSQATNATGSTQFGRFNGRRGTIGTVTAISDTSLTVQDARTNTSTTFSITSNTQISNAGAAATASSIQVGNTVLVRANPSNSKQADRILISPGMGGGPGASSNSGGTAPTTNSQTITN